MSNGKQVKYHINPKTGRPNQCTATVKGCQFAKDGQIPEHYDTPEEAREAYEKQNDEKTFDNTVKKETKNVTNDDFNKKPLKDVLRNANTTSISNVRDRMLSYDYSRQLLRRKDLNSIINNINNEYDELKDSPRSTKDEYYKKIFAEEGLEDRYDGYSVLVGEHDYYPSIEKNKDDFRNDVLQFSVYSNYSYETPSAPLLKRQFNDVDHEYEVDYVDNPDIDLSTSQKTIYSYNISDDEQERLHNQEKFEVAKQYKEIIDNPKIPNWMILPDQKNAVRTQDKDVENYKKANNTRSISRFTNINGQIESLSYAKKRLENAEKAKNKITDSEVKYQEETKKLDKLQHAIDTNNDPVIKKALQEGHKKQTSIVNKEREKVRKLKVSTQDEKIQKYRDKVKEIEDKLKQDQTYIRKENLKEFENDLAARYPSTSAKERRTAAQQWIKDNKDNLPDMDNYHEFRRLHFGYYA